MPYLLILISFSYGLVTPTTDAEQMAAGAFLLLTKDTPFLKRCVLVNPSHVYGWTGGRRRFFLRPITCLFGNSAFFVIFVNIWSMFRSYLSIFVNICTRHKCVHTGAHGVYTNLHIHISRDREMYMYMYTCIHVHMHKYICIYLHIYIYIHLLFQPATNMWRNKHGMCLRLWRAGIGNPFCILTPSYGVQLSN